jgi:succinyl-CoA synthetase beta subunit
VYVEERVDVGRELYVAVVADRERCGPLMLASSRGGMDVEDVPEQDIVRLPIDPFVGLHPFGARYLAARLDCHGDLASRFGEAVGALYRAFTAADAELVEVNPLVVTRGGQLVVADAKVVLDDNAAFRHPERIAPRHGGTPFEQRCAALGVAGAEMQGTIAVVVSGAGLMMATVDLLAAAGGRLRAAIDLGGTVFGDPRRLVEVVREVLRLRPWVVLVNGFFQLASCEVLAQGVADALADRALNAKDGPMPAIIVRLRGRGMSQARDLLGPLGLRLIEDLDEACRAAAAGGMRSA